MTTIIRDQRRFECGQVYWVDLDPVVGSEQGGRRPVLILSDDTLHSISGRIFVCPITSSSGPWPTKVAIPSGCAISGVLVTDQVRMIDRARVFRLIGSLPEETVLRVKYRLAAYLAVDPKDEATQP